MVGWRGGEERDIEWGQGGWRGLMRGEIGDIGDGGMKAANLLAMYAPMQQSCMICTLPQNLKYNKIYIYTHTAIV